LPIKFKSKNQHSIGGRRKRRLPVIAVTDDEKQALVDCCAEWRVNQAEAMRAALYIAGIFAEESLSDLPSGMIAHIKTHHSLVPETRAKDREAR
jgi:ribosome biogenesis protein Tsr3